MKKTNKKRSEIKKKNKNIQILLAPPWKIGKLCEKDKKNRNKKEEQKYTDFTCTHLENRKIVWKRQKRKEVK